MFQKLFCILCILLRRSPVFCLVFCIFVQSLSPVFGQQLKKDQYGRLCFGPKTADADAQLKASIPVQSTKVGNMMLDDLTLLLDNNRVDIKQGKRSLANGVCFNQQIGKRVFKGQLIVLGKNELAPEQKDRIVLKNQNIVTGDICAVGSDTLVINTADGASAFDLDSVQSVDSPRCIDLMIPLDALKGMPVTVERPFVAATRKAEFWHENRSPNWFSGLKTVSGSVQDAKPMLVFAAEDKDQVVAPMLVRVQRKKKGGINKELQKRLKEIIIKKKKAPGPTPPASKQPDEEYFVPISGITPSIEDLLIYPGIQILLPPGMIYLPPEPSLAEIIARCPENSKPVKTGPVKAAGGWQHRSLKGVQPDDFKNWVQSHFSEIDGNHDGFIDKNEAARAMQNPSYKFEDGVCVATLYRCLDQLRDFHNDGLFSDKTGVSSKDLDEFSKRPSTDEGRKTVKTAISVFISVLNNATTRDLFSPAGKDPRPVDVQQGFLNDCFFNAVAAGIVSMDPGLVKSMVEEIGSLPVGKRKFRVTLPGIGPVIVSEPTDAELGSYAMGTANGIWMPVIEKAYAHSQAPAGTTDTAQFSLMEGSNTGGGFKALLGGDFRPQSIDDYPAAHLAIRNAMNSKHPVMLGISKYASGNTYSLEKEHLYAAIAYDPEKQEITIYNSVGTEPSGAAFVDTKGNAVDGIFSMPLKEALKIFTHIQIADNSTDDAAKLIAEFKDASAVAELPPLPENVGDTKYICYYTREMIPQKDESVDGVPESSGTSSHEVPPGVYVCYYNSESIWTPEAGKEAEAPEKGKPPDFFVCYYEPEKIWASDPDQSPPGKDAGTGSSSRTLELSPASQGKAPDAFVCYYDPGKIWGAENGSGKGDEKSPTFKYFNLTAPSSPEAAKAKAGDRYICFYDPSRIWGHEPEAAGYIEEAKAASHNNADSGSKIPALPDKGYICMYDPGRIWGNPDDSKDLKTAQDSGDLEIDLTGDGKDTLHGELELQSKSSHDQKIVIPDHTIFVPSNPEQQYLAKLGDPAIVLKAGEKIVLKIDTICMSTKLEKPAQPKSQEKAYTVGDYPDSARAQTLFKIIATAEDMAASGSFDAVKVNPDLRARKIAQLALWKYLGSLSPSSKDDITQESIVSDLLESLKGKRIEASARKLIEDLAKQLDDSASACLQKTLNTR